MDKACSTHGEIGNAYIIVAESLKGSDQSEDRGADGRMILDLPELRWERVN
jgi:hypothetical protein